MLPIRTIAAVLAVGLLVPHPAEVDAREIILAVPGIPGPYCAYGLEKRMLELPGVLDVKTLWDLEQIRIVTGDAAVISVEDIRRAVGRADYPYRYEIRIAK